MLSDDKIFYLSSYENVKVVEQDSKITGANIHPVKIKPEQISSAYVKTSGDTFPCFLIIKSILLVMLSQKL